jgi:type I restriction enzyme R subunit
MADHEKLFQKAFIAGLQKQGWIYSGSDGCLDYDKGSAIIPSDLKQWIKKTQMEAWNQLVTKVGTEENALKLLVEDITAFRKTSPAKGGGTYNLLLNGITVRGVKFELFKNKPVSIYSPADSWKLYDNMILRVVSELHHSYAKPNDAIDLAMFINGISLSTTELKSLLGGQGVGHAEKQYKNDRIPGQELILQPGAGALFHIAAANNLASLTTALNGKDTYFLPFNTGIDNSQWHEEHGSNGYSVSYLWDDVFKKENLASIIFTMMRNIEVNDIWQTRFPRYHQFDNLRKIVESVVSENGNKNYLSQHAPGSGKSDEIANLAYALSNLQDNTPNPSFIYEKVIVVTNRTILDDQLKKLIASKMVDSEHFKHIQRDEKSSYISKSKILSEQLVGKGTSRILSVTAQTFSDTLLNTIQELKDEGHSLTGRFAIIVDEAHDGETGRQHQNMYRALLGVSLDELSDDAEEEPESVEEQVEEDFSLTTSEERDLLPSLNFFAYTATPNTSVLRVFGEPVTNANGEVEYKPFHSYSMHQAREEGYINDVLENYVTHDRFIDIEIDGNEYKGDRIVDFQSGRRQIGEWLQTQPEAKRDVVNVAVKKTVEIVIPSVNGEGKAMLSCGSRLDAVIYKRMIDAEIAKLPKEQQFETLVAFSGSVYDATLGREVTELDPALNSGMTKRDIAMQFEDNRFRLLIVADKYQVGFDQPKLVAMFLDKSLRGINLIQTTARVNRKIKGKEKVYIFDFVNKREDIQESFSAFDHDASLALKQEISVETLEKIKLVANNTGIHTYPDISGDENDVESYAQAVFSYNSPKSDARAKSIASMRMTSIIDRCVSEFNMQLTDRNVSTYRVEELHRYRLALKRFVSMYTLLSITRNDDSAIEVIYGKYGAYAAFFNALAKALVLSRTEPPTEVDVNALRLKNYRIVASGTVIRDENESAPAMEEDNMISLDVSEPISKMGPIEVLIYEINAYPELADKNPNDVKDFVDILVKDMKDDTKLEVLAKDNGEGSFCDSSDVKNKILKLLSRASRNKDLITKEIATELMKKQKYDTGVIRSFAKMLHGSFNAEPPSFVSPILKEPVYVERTEHMDSPLRIHHLVDAGYLHEGMELTPLDERYKDEKAIIQAAAIYYGGISNPDPSKAANRVRRNFDNHDNNANGWYFWGIKDGNGKLVPLAEILEKIVVNS